MGGRALNRYGVITERKDTKEFKRIGSEISAQILSDLGLVTNIIKCYHTKPDHGDLDILIRTNHDTNISWRDYITNTFKPQAIYSNGGVHSFDYDNFQIDFIPIIEHKWDTALVYFSYDPLGNIMGKTYHKFGLSYGWEGLFYKFRNFHGTNSADILLSNDMQKIFEFGGYDYNRYLLGFDTPEEIYRFCINGEYFDSEMFKLKNLKHMDRKRNRKRGSYHLFLKYINENNINNKYSFLKDKDEYLEGINNLFPEANLLNKLNELRLLDERNKSIAQKFNGNVVMTWIPSLIGKELGQVMRNFKDELGDNYDEFILNSTIDDIRKRFLTFKSD